MSRDKTQAVQQRGDDLTPQSETMWQRREDRDLTVPGTGEHRCGPECRGLEDFDGIEAIHEKLSAQGWNSLTPEEQTKALHYETHFMS